MNLDQFFSLIFSLITFATGTLFYVQPPYGADLGAGSSRKNGPMGGRPTGQFEAEPVG